MKKLLTILLCTLLLVGCAPKQNEDTSIKEEEIKIDYDIKLPTYYHYELNDYPQRCNAFVENANKGNFDSSLYEELFDEFKLVSDLKETQYMIYSTDVTNESESEEYLYIASVLDEARDIFASMANKLTKSSVKDKYKEYLNNDYVYNQFAGYNEKSQTEKDLLAKEDELINDYNNVSSKMYEYETSINGETYTFNDLLSSKGDALYEKDQEAFYNAYYGFLSRFNLEAGNIYLELVKLRDEIAKLNGYDNYALYMDENVYGRNYDISKLDAFKKIIKDYGEYVYYYISYFQDSDTVELSAEQLLSNAESAINQISPMAKDYYKLLRSVPGIYSIDKGDERYNGSYCSYLYSVPTGLYFLSITDNSSDYFTLAHEFGHFINANRLITPNPTNENGSYDVYEFHSSAMEVLFSLKAQDLLKDKWEPCLINNLIDKLYTVVFACILDDFQRQIYENPNMTLDEINQLFFDISHSYGFYMNEYYWSLVPHNFDSPMYYMSYGVAYFSSLQLYEIAKKDYNKAIKIYEEVMDSDPCTKGYFEIMSNAGLETIDSEKIVKKTLESILEVVNDAYEKYYED